jgi:hypothetical protein
MIHSKVAMSFVSSSGLAASIAIPIRARRPGNERELWRGSARRLTDFYMTDAARLFLSEWWADFIG